MKNKYNITLLFIVIFLTSVNAQQLPLFQLNADNMKNNTFVDADSDLEPYVGTWLFQQGNTSFKIILQKKTQSYDSELNSYFDMLIGEYEYIENGVTIVNTLPLLNDTSIGDFNHNINGYSLRRNFNTEPGNVRRVKLEIRDPEYPYLRDFILLRHYVDIGHYIEMLKSGRTQILTEDLPIVQRVPSKFYIMEKQP
jgi:hypothetical protein